MTKPATAPRLRGVAALLVFQYLLENSDFTLARTLPGLA